MMVHRQSFKHDNGLKEKWPYVLNIAVPSFMELPKKNKTSEVVSLEETQAFILTWNGSRGVGGRR